jgi:HD-like signal output (HDOD) protein
MLSWLKRKKKDPKAALTAALGEFQLPSFPRVIMEALDKLRDPDAAMADVSAVIINDPQAGARLLSLANSAVYALRRPVRNVDHAVSLLGRGEVEGLLLSLGVRKTLPRAPSPGYDPRRFWTAAARRATLARSLAALVAPSEKGECFSAALLGDMAIPLLAQARGQSYGDLLLAWHGGGGDLSEMEEAELGFNHALVAGWMSETWSFPERLRDAIGAHHDDHAELSGALTCVGIVGLLDESEGGRDALIDVAAARLNLPGDQVAKLTDDAFAAADGLAANLLA